MPNLSIDNFFTTAPKARNLIDISSDRFPLPLEFTELSKKTKKITDLGDDKAIKYNQAIIQKQLNVSNIDNDFFKLLTIISTAEKHLLPTSKELRNDIKKRILSRKQKNKK